MRHLRIALTLVVIAVVSASACDPRLGPSTEEASPKAAERTDSESPEVSPDSPEIQRLAEKKCGKCHLESQDSAIPAALDIFNLDEKAWWTGLSDEQLELFPSQFREMGDDLDDSDFKLVERWVRAVAAKREDTGDKPASP